MVTMPADESGVDVKEEHAEGDGKDVDVDGDHEMVDVPSSPTTVTTAATKIDSPVAMHSPSLKTFDPPVVEEVKLGTPGAKDDSESREMKARQMVENVDEDAQGEEDGDAEDVEKGIIACEACGDLISVRDEDKAGAFTMKYWEAHQGVWCVSFFRFHFLSFLISLFCFVLSRFRSLLRPCLLSSLRFRSSLLRVLPCHLREHRRAAGSLIHVVWSNISQTHALAAITFSPISFVLPFALPFLSSFPSAFFSLRFVSPAPLFFVFPSHVPLSLPAPRSIIYPASSLCLFRV